MWLYMPRTPLLGVMDGTKRDALSLLKKTSHARDVQPGAPAPFSDPLPYIYSPPNSDSKRKRKFLEMTRDASAILPPSSVKNVSSRDRMVDAILEGKTVHHSKNQNGHIPTMICLKLEKNGKNALPIPIQDHKEN
ncbi:hypothetical protein Tco_0349089 [Tanacetum coccineum]